MKAEFIGQSVIKLDTVSSTNSYALDLIKNDDIDEGVTVGGEYGPYRQSERKELYQQYSKILIERGHAYYAFDTPEELDSVRKEFEEKKQTFIYNASSRSKMNNSFTLSEEVLKNKI